jgi:alkanesulfonate monooxygenase SsuD/methylene tetrahydromethanopterin reductase-like flavin-dependent oxidoreductase (luciferase family)
MVSALMAGMTAPLGWADRNSSSMPRILAPATFRVVDGERTTRVAAELGDGWIPVFVSRERLAGRAAELDRARRAAGRPEPLTVAAGPWTVAAADAGTARGVVASCVAWYLTAMGDLYGRTVAGQGHGAAVRAVQAANPRPRPGHGVVPTRPGSCWRRTPPTAPPPRSASSWRAGTAPPT